MSVLFGAWGYGHSVGGGITRSVLVERKLKPIGWMKSALADARRAGKKLPKWLQEQSQREFDAGRVRK